MSHAPCPSPLPGRCPRQRPGRRHHQRGAALLVAMLIVTLVTTLAAGMVWQQHRAFEVEAAERARTQASWLLGGALDWARLILREDARDGGADGLTEPWATGLAEIRLSSFLASDSNRSADDGLDAFLSGQIEDAQARYNLRNLLEGNPEQLKAEQAILNRLFETLGLTPTLAQQLGERLRQAHQATQGSASADGSTGQAGGDAAALPLMPQRAEQLTWLGLDRRSLDTLAPYLVMLPQRSTVNINTAPVEVLMAAVEGLDRASAQRLAQQRLLLKKGFEDLSAAKPYLPEKVSLSPRHIGTRSSHFEVTGQLRYEDMVLRERSLLQRQGLEVRVLRRDRVPES
ncbi:type II secretion system minor pseudopilin GspK [Ideonella livida]|uniref:Type II secretion system protein K n=1 Tax=Ideonella livida TaxID=2707176 RepID=A0A7C9PIH5_9BURK|nr:type II secretion system minor pseudopilin GspK [Ideonella livida]NDY92776.1 type II secretion system minor pseudopilin GspK [Ideonella livida]